MQSRKLLTSFAAVNTVQFLAALNDNIFKLLLIFFLIHFKGAEKSNAILSLAGIIFVIPFLVFASLAGTLADRYSKRRVIVSIRLIEIVVMTLGVVMMKLESPAGLYFILFLMATQSAIFSPCKFGIIPEIVVKEKISHYNGVMTASAYLAIILGTFLASLLADVTQRDFVLSSSVCVVIAVAGAFFSLWIEKTKPMAPNKRISPQFITVVFKTLKEAAKVRYLLVAIIFVGYFLFMGSYVQLNIIPFALQSLHLTEIQGGYLFLMTAIGIGLGSFLSGRLSGREIELGFVPLATLGIMATLILLFFFAAHFYGVALLLVLLGILGGFYIVPMESFIQAASPKSDRGQNVAAANFISFLGVIAASLLIGLLGGGLGLSAATGFLVVGLATFFVALFLLVLMADTVLRLLLAKCASYFWRMEVVGREQLGEGPLLLVATRRSWLDTVVVMASLPRLIRYLVPLGGPVSRSRVLLYRLLALVPLDLRHFLPLGPPAIACIKKELSARHTLCLMQPVHRETKSLKQWEESVRELVRDLGVATLPVYILRQEPPSNASLFVQFFSLFRGVKIFFGKAEHDGADGKEAHT